MDLERARLNMVESQIRTWDVLDDRVLEAVRLVRREAFVPDAHRGIAFADLEIPLGHGEVMLTPKLEARLLQELSLTGAERVLEVGTGSGYMTALLARFSAHVVSVDIHADFLERAATRLAAEGITNITLEHGNAAAGWAARAPFDAIVLTGSVPVLPAPLVDQLRAGGRLIAVVGEAPAMTAWLCSRLADGQTTRNGLFDTCIAPLVGAPQPERFVF